MPPLPPLPSPFLTIIPYAGWERADEWEYRTRRGGGATALASRRGNVAGASSFCITLSRSCTRVGTQRRLAPGALNVNSVQSSNVRCCPSRDSTRTRRPGVYEYVQNDARSPLPSPFPFPPFLTPGPRVADAYACACAWATLRPTLRVRTGRVADARALMCRTGQAKSYSYSKTPLPDLQLAASGSGPRPESLNCTELEAWYALEPESEPDVDAR
ncbi:hypothetical protein C8Q78DRAFT_363113 [Trametes maxima]|nr:hypothetical protein C8Q78DRAFT_363113 [Trametes maxima]